MSCRMSVHSYGGVYLYMYVYDWTYTHVCMCSCVFFILEIFVVEY